MYLSAEEYAGIAWSLEPGVEIIPRQCSERIETPPILRGVDDALLYCTCEWRAECV
jgi:hypothetical protein